MRIDLRKDLPKLYRPGTRDFVEVDVPPTHYLAVDGHGDPDCSADYRTALELLYTAAYSVRAALKARTGDDFVVGPLEGLWTSADPSAFTERRRDQWDWTMLLPLPDLVPGSDVTQGLGAARRKKLDLPWDRLGSRTLHEGRCLQIMHLGSFEDEAPTLARLHTEVMPAHGLTFAGPHHEIYLGDARRVAPERMRTVLRQPVRRADAGMAHDDARTSGSAQAAETTAPREGT